MSVALTRRQFFVGYAALQFSFDQILNQWHHSLERPRIGEMVVQRAWSNIARLRRVGLWSLKTAVFTAVIVFGPCDELFADIA